MGDGDDIVVHSSDYFGATEPLNGRDGWSLDDYVYFDGPEIGRFTYRRFNAKTKRVEERVIERTQRVVRPN